MFRIWISTENARLKGDDSDPHYSGSLIWIRILELYTKSVQFLLKSVFRIRIRFLRIRILDFFRIRIQATKNKFFKGKNKILGEIFVLNPKSR